MNRQTDTNIVQAWPEAVQAEVKPRPWFAALLLQKGNQLWARFATFYARLTAVGQHTRRRFAVGVGTAALALALSSAPTPAHAAEITVSPDCTLVQAIQSANGDMSVGSCTAGSDADTIVLAGGTYSYTTANGYLSALPHITTPITIEANGATIQRTDGGANMRIITITLGGSLTLNNATITGGNVTVNDNNFSLSGGGILVGSNNTLIINNSTISGNTASGRGGGISDSSTMTSTLNNSTVSGNTATSDGGGINKSGAGTLILNNSTVSDNTSTSGAGGGIHNFSSTISLNRSIVSGNTASTNREINSINGGTVNVDNFNIIGHSNDNGSNVAITGTSVVPSGVLSSVLNPTLSDNGGPTLTHALVTGSPAIDFAPSSDCLSSPVNGIDQRGGARNFDGNSSSSTDECDAGAVEFRNPVQNCSLSTDSDIPINGVILNFTSLGSLSCVSVEEMGSDHLAATGSIGDSGIHTGNWWHISGNVNSGFNVRVTLPHDVNPDTNAKVCKFPGTQGGYGWDCFRTGSDGSTVWLDGQDSFSDWAVGDEVGPTAVTNLQTDATPAAGQGWLVGLLVGLLGASTAVFLRLRR